VVDSVRCLGTRPPAPASVPEETAAPRRPPPRTSAPFGPLRLDLDGPGAVARHLGASTHDAGIDVVVAAWTTAAREARAAVAGPPRHATPPPSAAAPRGPAHTDPPT